MALAIVTPVKAAQQQYVPTQEDIEITKNIKDIQTAGYYSTTLMENGDLWTWGSMGMDHTYESKTPSILMKDVKKIVLHNNFYAAIKNDGTLWTWGVDRYGNLGLDAEKTGKNVTTPEKVKFSDTVKIQEVVLSEGGCDKAAAITENGDLYMWGE